MPLAAFPLSLGLAALVTLASMFYLMLNARAVADLFRNAGLHPGPGRPPASRRAVIAALLLFNLGWISCLGIYWSAWSGVANDAIEGETIGNP